jgi:hypothetical protein
MLEIESDGDENWGYLCFPLLSLKGKNVSLFYFLIREEGDGKEENPKTGRNRPATSYTIPHTIHHS